MAYVPEEKPPGAPCERAPVFALKTRRNARAEVKRAIAAPVVEVHNAGKLAVFGVENRPKRWGVLTDQLQRLFDRVCTLTVCKVVKKPCTIAVQEVRNFFYELKLSYIKRLRVKGN